MSFSDSATQRLARRAARLGATLPAAPLATNLAFDSGHAFPGLLPDLTAEGARALSALREETLQYAPRAGLPALRTCIVEQMAEDGVTASPGEMLITNGAKHAIDLICHLLLDEGDAIVVTAPTYFTALPIFRSFGVQFIEVGQDAEGMDVTALAAQLDRRRSEGAPPPKFIYNVPDFHNPTGITMSHQRRVALLALAASRGIYVVEDSPYRQVHFDGERLPSLKALDTDGVVLHVGTFSKLMAPGLRVGWVVAAPELVARLTQLKSDGGSCPLTQRLIVEFLRGGRLPAHLAQVRATYRTNRDAMAEALRRELPEVSFDVPRGGYYIWTTFPDGTDGDKLAKAAGEAGVTILAGSRFFARPDAGHPRHHVRLAYSHATPEEAAEGVRRLAAAWRTLATHDMPTGAVGAR